MAKKKTSNGKIILYSFLSIIIGAILIGVGSSLPVFMSILGVVMILGGTVGLYWVSPWSAW